MSSPDVRESCSGYRDKVLLRHPGIPVLLEYAQCSVVVLHLAKRILVNNGIVVRIDKDAWRYPRLARRTHAQVSIEPKPEKWERARLPRVRTNLHWQRCHVIRSQRFFSNLCRPQPSAKNMKRTG